MIGRFRFGPRASGWRTLRRRHLREHGSCAACGTQVLVDVHHVVPYHVNRALELDPANLLTLCRWRRHHFRVGHLGDWQKWNPTVVADAAAMLAQR